MGNQFQANELLAAGKATATTTEQVIDVENKYGGFRKVSIDPTGATDDIMISIDVSFADNPTKIIYLNSSPFEEYLSGDKIYYKSASGSQSFFYVLL